MDRSSFLALTLALLAALLSPLRAADPDSEAAVESVAATVISLEGRAQLADGRHFRDLQLGQLLGPGDRVRTGEDGGLHMVLADGTSLVLGPGTELALLALPSGGAAPKTRIQLRQGVLEAIVEKLGDGALFEIRSPNAIATTQGADFELSAGPDECIVTVEQGIVRLGDSGRKRFEPVLPLHRRRLVQNRLMAAETLGKRDLNSFRERWVRARVFHGQREELLRHFRVEDKEERARFRRELLKRRAAR